MLLIVSLGAPQSHAINILTFDTQNPGQNSTFKVYGLSITAMGTEGLDDVDFSRFDAIYMGLGYLKFLNNPSLSSAFYDRLADLQDFVDEGGQIVFGGSFVDIDISKYRRGLTIGDSRHNFFKNLTRHHEESQERLGAVPEPATIGLFGVGLLALFFIRRRKVSRTTTP